MNLKNAYYLIKEYFWDSEERHRALLLFGGAILATIAFAGMLSLLTLTSGGLTSALVAMDSGLFLAQIGSIAAVISGLVLFNYLSNLVSSTLEIRWRDWLTKKILQKYTSSAKDSNSNDEEINNFLELNRYSKEISNPQQRIQEDVGKFVSSTLSLVLGFISSILNLAFSITTLWVVGGAFSFTAFGTLIVIPGFLVWVTLLFSVTASLITQYIGKKLTKTTQEKEGKEAEFRRSLEDISQQAESIAQEGGEEFYQQTLTQNMENITAATTEQWKVRNNVSGFQAFYTNLAGIFPYLAASPLYFSGTLDLNAFMQIGPAFAQVNFALNWFVNFYEQISDFNAGIERITQLEEAMSHGVLKQAPKNIEFSRDPAASDVRLDQVTITLPNQTTEVGSNLNLNIQKGQHTLFKGDNGAGKSTLFKVMAGTWRYGKGQVKMPKNSMFFPQTPTIPNDTLSAILAYPKPVGTYSEEMYKEALTQVGLTSFIPMLKDKGLNWKSSLSGGEKELIGFARVLLRKPDWLFLDEATAALNPVNEEKMYRLLKEELKGTTLVSISHRPSIEKFHNRFLFFKKTSNGLSIFEDAMYDEIKQAI